MAPKKLAEKASPTKKVRQTTVEEFEAPVEEQAGEVELEPLVEVDPIEDFFDEIDASRILTMHVWELTQHKINQLRGRRAPGAVFITQFPFSGAEIETYRSTIQTWQPRGAMFYIEVREGGRGVLKSWSEEIGPLPGFQPQEPQRPGTGPPYAPVIVHQHPNQPQFHPQPDPAETLRQHITLAKDLVAMAKDLMPPPAPININPNSQQEGPQSSLGEKILEAMLPALVQKGDKNDIKEALSIIAGAEKREPTFLEATAPVLLEAIKHFGPRLGTLMDVYTQRQQQQLVQPPFPSGSTAVTSAPQLVADPATRAWVKLVYRLIEDCQEAAEAPIEDLRPSPAITASLVVDLVDRYQQLASTVEQVMNASPTGVVDLCALVVHPSHQQRVMSLKQSPIALSWISELQQEVKSQLEAEALGTDKGENQDE